MKKRQTILLLLLILPLLVSAQKKQLSQAQDIIKSGKTLDKAETLMANLLADSIHRRNPKIWQTLFLAQRGQYEQANEKLYLKQKSDTTSFFRLTRKLILTAQSLDSVEQKRLTKSDAQPRSRHDNAAYLSQIRSNLFYGGTFFTARGNYSEALIMFDSYINCHRQPLFSQVLKSENDTLLSAAAYWAMSASMQQHNNDKALSYLPMARRDTTYLEQTLWLASEAYQNKRDTTHFVAVLRDGFKAFPLSQHFFPRLIDYYGSTANDSLAMQLVGEALAVDSLNSLFRLAKSSVLLNLGRYDECISVCRSLLDSGQQLPDAQYNMGIALFNKAITMEKKLMNQSVKSNQRRRYKRDIAELYVASRPHLEAYRKAFPGNVLMWSGPLYTIYLNLNMGKEFEEIEKIRDEYRKNNKQTGLTGAQ